MLKNKRIPGAYKVGRRWCIPKEINKPIDRRTNYSREYSEKKTVVIAGINSEIGKELSKILLEKGYNIIGLYQDGSKLDDILINKLIQAII